MRPALLFRSLPPLVAIAALAAVMSDPGDAEAARRRHRRTADAGADAADAAPRAAAADAGAADDGAPPHGDPGCLYGRMIDGHTGQIRCLGPEEVEANPELAVPPPDAGAREAGADAADAGGRAHLRVVSVSFEGGAVPRAEAIVGRLAKKELAECVGSSRPGEVTLTFLVRARGRAEGVEVEKARGVSAEAARCMAQVLARRPVGAPTADPVGVKVVLEALRGP